MLLMTPEYAALREQRARETIDWLVGNFDLRPLRRPVVARMKLNKAAATPAETTDAEAPAEEANQEEALA